MNKVTEIQIKPIKPCDGLIGFASCVINKEIYLSSIGIFTRLNKNGYRITYPSKKVGSNDLQIFHPITRELGKEIEKAVINQAQKIFEST
jgi:DNA-binding cell septation regulator SpoVG